MISHSDSFFVVGVDLISHDLKLCSGFPIFMTSDMISNSTPFAIVVDSLNKAPGQRVPFSRFVSLPLTEPCGQTSDCSLICLDSHD